VARTRAGRRVRDLMASRASRRARRTKRIRLRQETAWPKRQRSWKGTPGRVRPRITDPMRVATYRPRSGRGPTEGVLDTRAQPPTSRRVDHHPARIWGSSPTAGQPPRRCRATSPVRAPVLRKDRPAGPRRPRSTPLHRIPRPFTGKIPYGLPGTPPVCLTRRSPGTRALPRRLLLPRPRAESGHRWDMGCGRRRRRPSGRRGTFSATSGTGVVFRSSGMDSVRRETKRAVSFPRRDTEAPSRSGRPRCRSRLPSPASVSPWAVSFSVLRPPATAAPRCSP
jgi:hypothetical protein